MTDRETLVQNRFRVHDSTTRLHSERREIKVIQLQRMALKWCFSTGQRGIDAALTLSDAAPARIGADVTRRPPFSKYIESVLKRSEPLFFDSQYT